MLPGEIAVTLARDPRLIIPVGTLEQHGLHLPTGCDTIIAERLAADLSAEFGVLLAPTLEYGVNLERERGEAGTAAVRRKTLHRFLNDLLTDWEDAGVREFILLTAHADDPHQEALATVITTEARVRVVDIFTIPIADLLDGQQGAMHGDEVDTSLMLYLAPHLVRPDLASDYMLTRDELRRYRRGWLRVPRASAGSLGRPTLASAGKGERIYERIRSRVAERIFRSPAVVDD
ncbi:MAG TPA: creatininase family protein [Gemmatimonadales bacterium]